MKALPENIQARPTIGFLRRGYSATGGAEAYLLRLAAGLHAQGYRVVLLGTGDWPKDAWPGRDVVTLPSTSLRKFAAAALNYKNKGAIHLDLLFSMERVPGCDIFRAGDGVHAAWLQHRGKRKAPWRRWLSAQMPRHREVLALERELFDPQKKTRIIANSAMVACEIAKYFSFPKTQIDIIPNGVPAIEQLTQEERWAVRDTLGIAKEERMVLFVGSGWERKGLKVAIKAVERAVTIAPQMRLWVAGKGPVKNYRAPFVRFLGPVKKMSHLYAAADIFILPTLYDPFANASLEALAAGLPVITSATNGCSEIITEGLQGSVIQDPCDIKSFAVALEAWDERLKNMEETMSIHQACTRLGALFSCEKNLAATLEIIQQVLEEKAS